MMKLMKSMKPMKSFNESPMQKVVLGLIGLVLVFVAFELAGMKWGLILTGLLMLEGWALVNRYRNDTISEVLWGLSDRPIVPWMFGVGTGWTIQSGFVTDPWLILVMGFLQGHFWFQRYEPHNRRRSDRREKEGE